MPEIAVNVAVIQDHKILLTQREDFETWILPGGGMEPGESVAQAAMRETKEETGVEWFPFEQLPSPLSIGHKRRIEDATSGKAGLCVAQVIQMPGVQENMDRQKLYELRDQSGLPRQEFYLQWIEGAILKEETELGDFE